MKTKRSKIISVLGIFIILCVGIVLFQNTYDMKVTSVQIPTSKGSLNGSLVLPEKIEDNVGLVIFIHGDGPADASYNGAYEPLWEELAKEGYASLSWSKPGINGSEGNWLDQSMEDRATEAVEVINWAKSLPEIDGKKIGLWGASQAGWVIPKIVQLDKSIAFSILVAPAVNWVDQGLFNTLGRMKKEGSSLAEMEQAKDDYQWTLSLLEKNTTYQEYQRDERAEKGISEERWNFIIKNYQSDSTEDIKHFYSPVKLFLGGQDINVDSNNTKEVYEAVIPKELLSVTVIPTADHSMLRASLVDSKWLTVFTAIVAPRQLVDERYYNEIREFLRSLNHV